MKEKTRGGVDKKQKENGRGIEEELYKDAQCIDQKNTNQWKFKNDVEVIFKDSPIKGERQMLKQKQ